MTPQEAFKLADKEGPSNITRSTACQSPYWAYLYAMYIDKHSRDDTRLAACGDPRFAYLYAMYIDKCFNEYTYMEIHKNPETLGRYGKYLDIQLRENLE